MGNAAFKEFEELELGSGDLDAKKSITESLITKETVKLSSKAPTIAGRHGIEYISNDGKVLFTAKSTIKRPNTAAIRDVNENLLTVTRLTKHLNTETLSVYKTKPSFKGQPKAYNFEMDGVSKDTAFYIFARAESKQTLKACTCTYGVVTGIKDNELVFEQVYEGKKVGGDGMHFHALIESASSGGQQEVVPLAKVGQEGKVKKTVLYEIASGVDIVAIVAMACTLAPGDSVGGLAGAGIV